MDRWIWLMLTALAMPGCLQSNPSPPGDEYTEAAQTITDPTDYGYLQDPDDDARPHVHDYWEGQTTKKFYDGTVTVPPAPGTPGLRVVTGFQPPSGALIIPGSRWLNVTSSWNEPNLAPITIRIEYETANGSHGVLHLRNNGLVSLPLREEWNDAPHTQRTHWGFGLVLQNNESAWFGEVNIRLRMDIARDNGPLPVAPPHPDFWQNETAMKLFERHGPLFIVGHESASREARANAQPNGTLVIAPVRPETAQIRITYHYNSTTAEAGHCIPLLSWHGAEGWEWQQKDAAPTTSKPARQGGLFEWRLSIDVTMWDSPYANKTDWSIFASWTRQPPQEPDVCYYDGDFHLTVTAVKRTP